MHIDTHVSSSSCLVFLSNNLLSYVRFQGQSPIVPAVLGRQTLTNWCHVSDKICFRKKKSDWIRIKNSTLGSWYPTNVHGTKMKVILDHFRVNIFFFFGMGCLCNMTRNKKVSVKEWGEDWVAGVEVSVTRWSILPLLFERHTSSCIFAPTLVKWH